MSNIKALVAAIFGLLTVGGVGTYVVLENMDVQVADVLIGETVSDEVSSQTGVTAANNIAPEPEKLKDEITSLDNAGASSIDNALPIKEPGSAVPTFDLLRVEPDGSTVIAGKGEPNSKILVMDGESVVGQTEIGVSGDFVIVFDDPLVLGEHELSLRMEDSAGNIVQSEEVGFVSIPKDSDGQVLAMVSKPGSASRIMTAPEAENVDTAIVEVAVADAPTKEQDGIEDLNQATEATKVAETKVEDDVSRVVAAAADDVAQSAQPMGGEASSQTQQEVAVLNLDDQSSTDLTTDNVVPSQSDLPVAKSAGDKMVEAEPKPVAPPKVASVLPNVRIEAVEVEGDMLFVAGVGTEGNQVRVFVDDNEAGLSPINPEGRFLLEANMPLSVGQHLITAALEDSANKVLLRAIVPFTRPETEAAAAVAAAETSPTALQSTTDENVIANEGTLSEVEPDQVVAQVDTSTDKDVKSNDIAAASPKVDNNEPKIPLNSGQSTGENVEIASAEAENTDVSAPATIVQDSLTPAASQSVIIRRGDTLWQIARRTYGQGVRYTTIYLANQDQIKNPNRISPGQIFSVPEVGMDFEEAEGLHMDLSRTNR